MLYEVITLERLIKLAKRLRNLGRTRRKLLFRIRVHRAGHGAGERWNVIRPGAISRTRDRIGRVELGIGRLFKVLGDRVGFKNGFLAVDLQHRSYNFV